MGNLTKAIRAQIELVARLRAEIDAKQAKIDALMLEYCPDEMTPGQLANWSRHQRVAPTPEGMPS